MKLRTKYILFVAILHIVALLLSYFIFDKNKIFFIVSEVFIIISIIISWQLYNELIHPIDLLIQGADAIRDRDFNVKFLSTGKYEMDKLIKVYNEMMDELRTERTKQEEQHLVSGKTDLYIFDRDINLDFNENIQLQVNPRALQLSLGVRRKRSAGENPCTNCLILSCNR